MCFVLFPDLEASQQLPIGLLKRFQLLPLLETYLTGGIVPEDVDILIGQTELKGVLNYIFVELVVKQRVRVLLPCYGLHRQLEILILLAKLHSK